MQRSLLTTLTLLLPALVCASPDASQGNEVPRPPAHETPTAPSKAKATKQSSTKNKNKAPAAFTTNCVACHDMNKDLVGPSLVQIAIWYPRAKQQAFVDWCLNPGKRNPDMAQMPSMAHIEKSELIQIHRYILEKSKGQERIKMPKVDPFLTSEAYTRRPRLMRSFFPNTGPASLLLALPTTEKHNIIWDTDSCSLAYIAAGAVDNYTYWRSNGNSLAKVGKELYRPDAPLFSQQKHYRGYAVDAAGFATIHYIVAGIKVSESYSVKGNSIVQTVKSNKPLPSHSLPSTKEHNNMVTKVKAQPRKLTIEYSLKTTNP